MELNDVIFALESIGFTVTDLDVGEFNTVLRDANYIIALTTKYGGVDYYCMDSNGTPVSFVMQATGNTMRSGTNYHITETELTGRDLDIGYVLLGCGHCGHYADPVIRQYGGLYNED